MSAEHGMDRSALQQLHAEAQAPFFAMQIKNAHDPRMHQMPQGEILPSQGRLSPTLMNKFGQQSLERHHGPQVSVLDPPQVHC
jgi:hypothetical protein